MDGLKAAWLVLCASSHTGLDCPHGDLLVDFVVGEEAFASFQDLDDKLDKKAKFLGFVSYLHLTVTVGEAKVIFLHKYKLINLHNLHKSFSTL